MRGERARNTSTEEGKKEGHDSLDMRSLAVIAAVTSSLVSFLFPSVSTTLKMFFGFAPSLMSTSSTSNSKVVSPGIASAMRRGVSNIVQQQCIRLITVEVLFTTETVLTSSFFSITHMRWDSQSSHFSDAHADQTLFPAGNHLTESQLKIQRRTSFVAKK